jgi:hypothetical protein
MQMLADMLVDLKIVDSIFRIRKPSPQRSRAGRRHVTHAAKID